MTTVSDSTVDTDVMSMMTNRLALKIDGTDPVQTEYYKFSKEPRQSSVEMIKFLENEVKDMAISHSEQGLICGRKFQSMDGIIRKLMVKNLDSKEFRNTPAVYYMTDDLYTNVLKKIGYTITLVRRIVMGKDKGYNNDNIEPAFSSICSMRKKLMLSISKSLT